MRSCNPVARLRRVVLGLLTLALLATGADSAGAQDQQAEKEREATRLAEIVRLRAVQLEQQVMQLQLQAVQPQKIEMIGLQQPLLVGGLKARRLEAPFEQIFQRKLETPFEQIEQLVFQQDGNAAGARKRLDALLAAQLDEIDRACTLSDAQRKKLLLAGRGDVNRFFDRYDGIKQKALVQQREEQDRVGIQQDPVAMRQNLVVLQQNLAVMQQEVSPLRSSLQTSIFHVDSLLYKALPNTLTGEQFARYEKLARERRETHHRASIETALKILERGKPFSDAQRRELLTLLTTETKPSRRSSPNDFRHVLIQLGRMPEENLKALFGDTRWNDVSRLLAQYKAQEPRLKEDGLLPAEDDEGGRPGAPAAGPKK